MQFTDSNHNRGLSDLVCLCNPLSLLEGSSDNLETSFNFKVENSANAVFEASETRFISAMLNIQTFVGQSLHTPLCTLNYNDKLNYKQRHVKTCENNVLIEIP